MAAISEELVARPPINPSSFETLRPDRLDEVLLYRDEDAKSSTDSSGTYRFKLTVVDRKILPTTRIAYATAVFLIPAGRESEYMFSSGQGLRSIAKSAQAARLIAVSFGRTHTFVSQKAVQEELTFVVQVLARQGSFLPPSNQKHLDDSTQQKNNHIPFMALDGIGKRNVVAQGETDQSGKFLVEQVEVSGTVRRRLYFLDNPFVIQSEVVLANKPAAASLDESLMGNLVDKSQTAFDYYKAIVAGLLSLSTISDMKEGILIGLGGGGLVNFLQYCLPNLHLTAVELDARVAQIAQEYFGVDAPTEAGEPGRWTLRVGDGLEVQSRGSSELQTTTTLCFEPETMSFVIIDVDSKDRSVGMSCPPQAFVQTRYLDQIYQVLRPDGILAMNVSARNCNLLKMVCRNVATVFSSVFVTRATDEESDEEREDVNVALFATRSVMTLPALEDRIGRLERELDKRESIEQEVFSDLRSCCEDLSSWSDDGQKKPVKKKPKKKKRGKKR